MIESLLAAVTAVGGAIATKKWVVPAWKACSGAIRGAIREFRPSDPKIGNGAIRDRVDTIADDVRQVLIQQNRTFPMLHDAQTQIGQVREEMVAIAEKHDNAIVALSQQHEDLNSALSKKHDALHERLDVAVRAFNDHIEDYRKLGREAPRGPIILTPIDLPPDPTTSPKPDPAED